MNSKKPAPRAPRSYTPWRLLLALALLIACASGAAGQAATDVSTPPGLTPGAPAGSYALSGFDNVNLYNGHLNFRLPLLKVGGRGSAGYTMTLALEQKWLVQHQYDVHANTHYYWPDPNWWSGLGVGLGAGTVEARPAGIGSYICPENPEMAPRFEYTFTRLTVKTADGTEYELVDKATLGRPNNAMEGGCTGAGFNRGKEFVTADGTAATFVSDSDIYDLVNIAALDPAPVTGHLYLRDGTRYRVVDGVVREIRDRNGNKVSLGVDSTESVTSATDSLGRQVTVEYGVTDPSYGHGTRINYSGFGGAARSIFISHTSLGSALRSGYSLQTPSALFNIGSGHTTFNPTVVSAVWLPDSTPTDPSDNRRYQFQYNSHGELARVVLPTGGAFEYDYQGGLSDGPDSGLVQVGWHEDQQINYQIYRRVVRRRVYKNAADTTPQTTMIISRPERYGAGYYNNTILTDGYVEKTERAGGDSGVILAGSRHHFHGSAARSMDSRPGGFSPWREGREHKTEALDTDGSQLTSVLRRVEHTWQQKAAHPWWSWWVAQYAGIDPQGEPANDPRLVTTVTTVEPSGANLVSKQTAVNPQTGAVGFDQYNNQTDAWEYGFGATPGTVGALVRRTHTDYVTPAAYVNSAADLTPGAHLRGLPSASWVSSDAGGANKVSRTDYEYDNHSTDARHAPLVPRQGITGHDAASLTVRGNATGVTSYADAAGQTGAVTASTQYDVAGNAVKTIDPLGRAVTVTYGDSFCNGSTCGGTFTSNTLAFPVSTSSPVPDPSGQYGSATPLVTSSVYDFWTGLVTSTTDANGETTTLSYADESGVLDPFDRLRKVVRPGGMLAGGGGQTLYDYGDTPGNLFVRTRTAIDATRSTESYQYLDGLGRPFRSIQYENQDAAKPWLTADTEYDALGRVKRASQSYRAAAGVALFSTDRWAETSYDALGRVKSVKTMPDAAALTTDYAGSQTTVTDPAGKKRRSVTDAFGRLTSVTEAPDVATCQTDGAGCTTSYTYDASGNLRKVAQGAQSRYFMYDSLGRLVRAKNPEQGDYTPDPTEFPAYTDPVTGNAQWSLAYAYDAAGNLWKRKDARNIKTTYAYDALNRNTTADYSDTSSVNPDVKRLYDKAAEGMGRLWQTEAGGAAGTLTTVLAYDAVGRPTSQNQQFKTAAGDWGTDFITSRSYDLAGNVTSQTYPSLHVVSYTYDAAGRLNTFTGRLGDGVLRTYSDQMRYDDGGRMEQERFGTQTPVYNKSFYNVRGQLSEIRVSTYALTHATQSKNRNRGAIINHYSLQSSAGSGTDNNGNLRKQDVLIPSDDATTITSQTTQFYTYDALNRLDLAREERGGAPQWGQDYSYDRWGNRTISAAGSSGNVPVTQFTVDPATNRLLAPSGQSGVMQYDAAGNLTQDTYTGQGARTYNAENRMTSAVGLGGQTSSYTYDADGRRVRRQTGTQETWQVYGFEGELLAEYTAAASRLAPTKEYGYRGGTLLLTAEGTTAPTETNLALGKSATQSSTYTHATNPAASKAVDGNTDGNFSNSSMSYTNSEAQAWWHVNLGAVQQINTVKVWNRSDCCADRLTNFYVLVSDAPFASNNLTATLSQLGVSAYPVSGQGGRPTSVAVNRTGRYVRVQLVGTNYLGLAEVEVLGVAIAEPVVWTSAVGVTASGNNLTKSASGSLAWNAGASSTKAIGSGDGYVEFTAIETTTNRMMGLSHGDSDQSHTDVDFAIYPSFTGALYVYEKGSNKGQFGTYAAGDRLRVSVEGGQVKYSKNGTVFYESTAPPQYPLSADASLYHPNATITDAVIAAAATTDIRWLVSDQLGTPRMVLDRTGTLAGVSRHDYLPFGEELQAGVGGRTTGQGYSQTDNLRQKFTKYERDGETGLDYAQARYYSYSHGRFTSPDDFRNDSDPDEPQSWNLYGYVRNNPLIFIDPTGKKGDYYEEGTGRWVGTDQINDNKVYVGKVDDVYVDPTTGIRTSYMSDVEQLSVTHTEFQERAATTYGESSAHRSSVSMADLADEMKAIAYVNQRNNVAYGADSGQAQTFRNTHPERRTGKMQLANAAVINQLTGGPDPSYGATMWDGMDQALFPDSDKRTSVPAPSGRGTWELHKNTMGWSISDPHYAKWKANVGRGFKAPQTSVAVSRRNRGRIRLNSTAVYGQTIFWKVVP